ncbi:MAG: 2-C-methyl-D-erythritol 4-phosphate cytidylyltransferase [Pseudomonadota bacterium]
MNPQTNSAPAYWAVIPAAGVGKRMGGEKPKQYLTLAGAPIIEHTLARLAAHPKIKGIMVAIAPGDPYWHTVRLPVNIPVKVVYGGRERCYSVLNALEGLRGLAAKTDWVLVHDAARPCVRVADIEHLITALADHPVGGLLGLPVSDTMKRTDDSGTIQQTVPRSNLWRALTPQMFRYGMLIQSLAEAVRAEELVTDEAAAIEWAGYRPRMVEGHADNIKITHPQDLQLAALFLQQQKEIS